jgi:predicted ATPase
LFTDIEGSTRRWEADPEAMRSALDVHAEVLRTAIEGHGGWLFNHTGDGVCAAFGSARGAINAAVAAQRTLALPVRMGIATGEAERCGDEYFGPVLNRTARVMTAGHGGQILVAGSTAAVASGVELIDRGEHRLRDLSGVEHLYQVRAAGLRVEFAPLRTLDAVPGNLPVQTTSFVGRETAVKELAEQMQAHRLVTLTGVGGVGKTRLAVQVAAGVISEFPDGVWLVELAPVGEPDALADAVATVVGVTPQAGLSMTASLVHALSGRRLLLVLDNCEHLLDAAADLVRELLTHTATVRMVTTSREALRVAGEQVWSVPSLDVDDGVRSAAVALFVERAHAVNASFALADASDGAAVVEVCRRLDGIALAIELAAARTVAMSVQDVRDHLGERFRLLSGSRRGLERHQTLRQAVQWSYDLLGDDERSVLQRCSVFAGGFDLAAATTICEHADDYAMLDVLESLARKSLITVEPVGGHARYGMLETIRQFAEEHLAATDTISHLRDRHAAYYAEQAMAHWDLWEGPGYRAAADWVAAEFANLRAGFRWAADHADLATAAAIAAHITMMGFFLQLFEPMGWVDEILPAASAGDLAQLPRLYTAAGLSCYIGHFDDAAAHSQSALAFQDDPRYDPFDQGWSRAWAAIAHGLASGDLDRDLEMCADLAGEAGLAHIIGLGQLVYMLPVAGRADEARAIAADAVSVARVHGNPVHVAMALIGTGRALADTDPAHALEAFHEALVISKEQRIPFFEARVAEQCARIETMHGDLAHGFTLIETALDAFHRAGNTLDLAAVLGQLALVFARKAKPEIAATIYGASRHYFNDRWARWGPPSRSIAVANLRAVLGDTQFDYYVAVGAAMAPADAVAYAREQIQAARRQLVDGN